MAKTIEVKKDQQGDIEKQRDELRKEIGAVAAKLSEIQSGIEQTEEQKIKAKVSHECCFDQGDEAGMKKALSSIRDANTDREKLIASLSGFYEKITELRQKHEALLTGARSYRLHAEEKMKATQAEYEIAKTKCDSVHGIFVHLNSLNDKLKKIQDRFNPPKDDTKRIESNVPNV